MKSSCVLSLILLLCSYFYQAQAAVAYAKAVRHPAFPNSCLLPSSKEVIKAGFSKPMKDVCGEAECVKGPNSELYLHFTSCGVIKVEEPCYLETDLSLSYPDCCPRVRCPDDEVDDSENLVADYDVDLEYSDHNDESLRSTTPEVVEYSKQLSSSWP